MSKCTGVPKKVSSEWNTLLSLVENVLSYSVSTLKEHVFECFNCSMIVCNFKLEDEELK